MIKMNLLQFKQNELKMFHEKFKDDACFKFLKWFMNDSIYITDINLELSKELSKNAEPKSCYANCFRILHKTNLRYIEGYVYSKKLPIPIEHAYMIDENNKIVDPTLAINESKTGMLQDQQYLGKIIDKTTLTNMLMKRKTYDNNLIELYLKTQS